MGDTCLWPLSLFLSETDLTGPPLHPHVQTRKTPLTCHTQVLNNQVHISCCFSFFKSGNYSMFSLRDQTLVLQILGTGFEWAMVETGSSGIDSETYVYSKVFPGGFLIS